MTPRFLIIAAVMVAVALACVLVPLVRSARRHGRPRAPFVLALLIALATPPAVLGIYLKVGTPQALEAVSPAANRAELAAATQQLEASLAKKPDDPRGWALLAQAYAALDEPQQALGALDRLAKLRPDDPDVMVAWVEASAQVSPDHLIGDAGRARLEHALQVDPTHQRALWLLGISDFQRGDYARAAQRWNTLLPLLDPGSNVAATVKQELAEAESRAGGAAASTAPASAGSTAPAVDGAAALNVTVKLAPKLADQLRPGDVLYVFARAVDGPPVPLAVTRLHPSRIPVEVTLTDKMAIAPGVNLSKYPRVRVAALISKSGSATPRPGDLESTPVEVATTTRTPVAITIDKVN